MAQSPSSHQLAAGLVACGVDASYAGGGPVLRAFSASFSAGEVCVIAGPNGAGKSTLLRVLLGTHTPTRGSVTLQGEDVRTMKPSLRAQRIAYIAQRASLAFSFSAREVVEFGMPWLSPRARSAAARDALSRVALAQRAEEPLGALSHGQQQRVSFARALAQFGTSPGATPYADVADTFSPRVLLADEPVSAMDTAHVLGTLHQLRALASQGVCVVLVLHDLLLASRFASRIILLDSAGALASDTPPTDLSPQTLEKVYGVPFTRTREGFLAPAELAPSPATAR